MLRSFVILTYMLFLIACGGEGVANNEPSSDSATSDTVGTADSQPVLPTIPQPPHMAGVVYVAHLEDPSLMSYRIDGDYIEPGPILTMTSYSHDLALDGYNDRLYVAHDANQTVEVYQLSRPASPEEPLTPPLLLSTINVPDIPRFLLVDPHHDRLYIAAFPPGSTVSQTHLYIYDVSSPATPAPLSPNYFTVPVTYSWALDPVRRILFVIDNNIGSLHMYDVSQDNPVLLPNGPLSLRNLYPQENQSSFSITGPVVDPANARFYAARNQGALSETVVLQYPIGIQPQGVSYSTIGDHSSIFSIPDYFDVNLPIDEFPNLLGGFGVLHDRYANHLFLISNAWDGASMSSLVVPMLGNLTPGSGCGDYSGFGCWYTQYTNGAPGNRQLTEGAACVDGQHKVVVGTSYNVNNPQDAGSLHAFRYDDSLTLSPLLTQDGNNPITDGSPVAIGCH